MQTLRLGETNLAPRRNGDIMTRALIGVRRLASDNPQIASKEPPTQRGLSMNCVCANEGCNLTNGINNKWAFQAAQR